MDYRIVRGHSWHSDTWSSYNHKFYVDPTCNNANSTYNHFGYIHKK